MARRVKTKRTSRRPAWRFIPLAEQLRRAAAESGLSVYRIARDTGVDQSTFNKFMNGTRENLRLDVADRVFRYFFFSAGRKRRRRISSKR